MSGERTVETERDYVHADKDPDAFFMKVVDAVTGEEIPNVIEANAVDGWFYQFRQDDDRKIIMERYIDDRGLNTRRAVRFREERQIAIIFTPEAPASLRGHEFRLKAQ